MKFDVISVAALLLLTPACHGSSTSAADGAPPANAKSVIQLPVPFSDVKLGMTQAQLEVAFPASEDITHCAPQLVGGDLPKPPVVPGAEKQAHSRCARAAEIGGPSVRDFSQMITTVKEVGANDNTISDTLDAALYSWAQVRGAIRAGAVSEAALIQADRNRGVTAFGALTDVADALFRGGYTFATSHQARREVSAVIADGCDDMDPDRVRKYFDGALSLGQIDADAHSRVVYGKCRGPFLQNEKELARDFARRAGAFGGIGLARASRADRQLKSDDAASYSIYSSRSKLDASVAKFGVLVANAIPEAESYWKGAVALEPAELGDGGDSHEPWSRAIVWLRDGHVVRALVNIAKDDKLGDLPKTLADFYASAGITKGTMTTWALGDGTTVTLDIGAATSLVVENATSPAPAASASTASSVTVAAPAPSAKPAPATARDVPMPPVPAVPQPAARPTAAPPPPSIASATPTAAASLGAGPGADPPACILARQLKATGAKGLTAAKRDCRAAGGQM